MSRQINVNPGNYKVAGRERQGEDIVQDVEKRRYGQLHAEAERWQSTPRRGNRRLLKTVAKGPGAGRATTTGKR